MKSKIIEKLQNIFSKLKKSKRLQVLLLVAFILIILVCYFSFTASKNTKNSQVENDESVTTSYISSLETKLKNSLLNLNGVNEVNVMITLENGFEYIYAMEQQTKQTTSGTLTTSSLVLVSGQPVIVKEIYPTIKGVVVVCKDAKDINIKLNILSAIQTVLSVSNEKITILN